LALVESGAAPFEPMASTRSQPAPAPRNFGSEATTPFGRPAAEKGGLRITVRPEFLPEHSDADALRFVFGYHINIHNEGAEPVTLVSRHWVIVDGDGDRHEVEGDGVVGHQPRLEPGESFEYASYCPLETRWGTMEGVYHMRLDDGSMFDAVIARFFLVAPELERGSD
jgi:ApaG protein